MSGWWWGLCVLHASCFATLLVLARTSRISATELERAPEPPPEGRPWPAPAP